MATALDTPGTWQHAARLCVSDIAAYADSPINKECKVRDLRLHLDALIEAYQADEGFFPVNWESEFKGLGATAYWTAYNEGWEVKLDQWLVALLARKQHDYGPENILRFGVQGLLVRLHDKVARLENRLSKRDGKNAVNGEGVIDTLKDIVGYCVIGMLLVRSEFTNPLGAIA